MLRYKTVVYDRNSQPKTTWRKTTGKFNNWTRGGPFNFVYAVIVLRSSVMFIPKHDIHPDDLATLPAAE